MAFNVEYKESGDFILTPQGQFQGVAAEILDLGMSEKIYKAPDGTENKRNVHEIQYVFQLNKVDAESGKRYEVRSRPMNTNLSDKATLRDFLRQWRGHDLTDAEKLPPGIDLETLVGKNCLISVIHNKVGDKTYANIGSIMPLVEGMPEVQALNYESKQAQIDAKKAKAASEAASGGSQRASASAAPAAATTDTVKADEIPF